MNAAMAIVSATLRQIVDRKRLLLLGALTLSPGLIYYLSTDNLPTASSMLDLFLEATIFHFSLTVPITALILSAAALGAERRDQTLSFVVLRPIGRLTIASAKLGSAFLAAVALNVLGALMLSAAYGARSGDWSYTAALLAGSAIATVVYTAIFVPLGYLSERSTLIGLAYAFIWENGIVGAIGVLGVTSPWRIGYSAFAALAPSEIQRRVQDFALADLTLSVGTAVVQAAAFAAASAALLTWILNKRDLV